MQIPTRLPRYSPYSYVLFTLASLFSGLMIAASSNEILVLVQIFQQEGYSELVYRIEDRFNLLPQEPNIKWESAPPEELGLDQAKLRDLGNQLASQKTKAFLVVKDGKIAYEGYSPGLSPNHRFRVSTGGKAIGASIALAVAIDAGLIDLDSPAWQFIPSWKNDPLKSSITVRHLISHSSGIENVRWGIPGLVGWKDEFDRDLSARFPLTLDEAPMLFEPGSRFKYSSVGFYALSYILTASLGDVPESNIESLLQNRIMDHLGIPNSAWSLDYGGPHRLNDLDLYYAGEGRYSARAIARIGQLMLNQGVWDGQILIQPETVNALVSYGGSPEVRPTNTNQPGWALGWRLNDDGFFPSLPRDSILALQTSNKVILVIPSLDLVAVRFGAELTGDGADDGTNEDLWTGLNQQMFSPLMEAVNQ